MSIYLMETSDGQFKIGNEKQVGANTIILWNRDTFPTVEKCKEIAQIKYPGIDLEFKNEKETSIGG